MSKDKTEEAYYVSVKERYKEGGNNWELVVPHTYLDPIYFSIAVLRLAEEISGKKIMSSNQFKSITGLDRYIEDKKDKGAFYYTAQVRRYEEELIEIINKGGKYKDLLKLDSSLFGLGAEPWDCIYEGSITKETIVSKAIFKALRLDTIRDSFMALTPSLRDRANQVEAPYSVLLEATKIWD